MECAQEVSSLEVKKLVNNIRSERARLGLTQCELANRLSVDTSTISDWENAKRDIPSGKAKEMSNLFDCSVDYLFGLSAERAKTRP